MHGPARRGCGVPICPAYGRACYACFGPREQANTASLHRWFAQDRQLIQVDRLAGFNAFRRSASPRPRGLRRL